MKPLVLAAISGAFVVLCLWRLSDAHYGFAAVDGALAVLAFASAAAANSALLRELTDGR